MKKLPFRQEAISTIWSRSTSQVPSNLPHKARHFSHPPVTQEPHPTDDIAGHHLSDAHLGVSESHLPQSSGEGGKGLLRPDAGQSVVIKGKIMRPQQLCVLKI